MKQRRKGFTLVELIVVIAIIGILAAVLIPTFSGAIESARKADDRLTVSNMNKTLTTYLAYHQIDAKDLDASEVQYIVSTEEEQYTFQPAYEGGVFWYNSNAGRIEYAETMGDPSTTIGGTMALANGGTPASIEDVYGNGYLYLNAGGELATFLLNLRNLGSVQDYDNLASVASTSLEGVPAENIKKIYDTFDPAQTLYVNSTGGFVDYTANTYSNKPEYSNNAWSVPEGTVYRQVTYSRNYNQGIASIPGWGEPTVGDKVEQAPDYDASTVSVGLASTFINQGFSGLTSVADARGDYWAIKVITKSGETEITETTTFYEVKRSEAEWLHPEKSTIKNVVFATGLRVVPALNLTQNIEVEGDITLPATVYTVMPNAFTEVTSSTRLVAKSRYAEVITGALGVNMTTSIAEKTTTALVANVANGNDLLKVYLVQNDIAKDTILFGWIKTGYASLASILSNDTYKNEVVDIENIVFEKESETEHYIIKNDKDTYAAIICFDNTSTGDFIGKIDLTAYKEHTGYVEESATAETDGNGDTEKAAYKTRTENAKALAAACVANDTRGYFLVGDHNVSLSTYETGYDSATNHGGETAVLKGTSFTQPVYRLYLDTSDLVKAFPTIHTIDVKYTPRYVTRNNVYTTWSDNTTDKKWKKSTAKVETTVQVYDITIQAFDNSGMCLNMVVTYEMA